MLEYLNKSTLHHSMLTQLGIAKIVSLSIF